jgi:hypothetical protein
MNKGAEEPVVQVGVALVSIRPDQDTQIALVAKENYYYLTKHKILSFRHKMFNFL